MFERGFVVIVEIESIMMGGNYESVSFSSRENIYELIWYYDIVKSAAESGNENAIVVILDFERLLNSSYKSRPMNRIVDCIAIQEGRSVIGKRNPDKSLLELLSIIRGESLVETEFELDKDIDEVVRINNCYWKNSLELKRSLGGSKYGIKGNVDKDRLKSIEAACWDIDKKIKSKRLGINKIEPAPAELDLLVGTYTDNLDKLNELRAIKNRSRAEQNEMNARIRYSISLNQDIQLIKDSYGILYASDNATPSEANSTIVSYVSGMHDVSDDIGIEDSSSAITEWQVNKIRYYCQDILTNRQLMWFEMYYIEGLSQREISRLTGRDQANISRALSASVNKIKEFLEFS